MPEHTRADVEAAVAELFEPSQHAPVFALLDRYGVEPYERERERVQIAVVKLSQGNFARLIQFVESAKHDYRDVLW